MNIDLTKKILNLQIELRKLEEKPKALKWFFQSPRFE